MADDRNGFAMRAHVGDDFIGPAHPGFVAFDCAVREKRAAMTDEEFWADVFPMVADPDPEDDVEVLSIGGTPCPVCGCAGECGVDTEGRPMIHAIPADLDE